MNKKNFYIFLIVNAFLWICVESMRLVTSADSMEAVVWGDLLSFGTHKHPPLSGWLAGCFHHLFGDTNIGIYILGNLCVIIGLIYIYKLAKFFLSEKEALCSSLILTPSFYYTFQVFYDNFNCNILLMALWPILIYYFYKSIKYNNIKDWIFLGVFAGLGFMAKYQVAILFVFMFLYLIFCESKLLKQKRIYVSVLIAFLIVLPHLIWLYNTDFFSFFYFIDRTSTKIVDPAKITIFKRMTFSIKFYLDQIAALAPSFVLYLILAVKEKNISFNNSFKENTKDKIFLLTVGLLPLIAIGATGIFTASRVVGAWGVSMICSIGILLFYFFPIKFSEQTYKFFLKWIYGMMICWQITMLVFFFLQTKRDFSYPYKQVTSDFNAIWEKETNGAPLKYIAGDYAISSQIYNVHKPKAILDTYGHQNPWLDHGDIINSGVLVMCYSEGAAANISKDFNENYSVNKYSYKISNILNKTKLYDIYYVVIKPQSIN